LYSTIKIKQIKCGTIEKLIDNFTNENGELDSNITNTFLATYRTFTNTEDVLGILFKKLVVPLVLFNKDYFYL
jgi:ral guanine nucleotide dissociation stimulator-like 1